MDLEDLKAMLRTESDMPLPDYSITGDIVTASRICRVTGSLYSVSVPLLAYQAWRNGELIQRALPALSPVERDFLTTGMTPAEASKFYNSIADAD